MVWNMGVYGELGISSIRIRKRPWEGTAVQQQRKTKKLSNRGTDRVGVTQISQTCYRKAEAASADRFRGRIDQSHYSIEPASQFTIFERLYLLFTQDVWAGYISRDFSCGSARLVSAHN
jgi:hypothetical protein